MSWQTHMVPIVRGLIFDLTSPYTYCDTRLEELICTCAVLVIQEVDLSTTYTVNLSTISITPDPSGDEDFVALVCLKTACLISQGEHREAAKMAVSVKDGPAFVDTKERAKHLGAVADDACGKYESAKVNYQIGDGTLGRAIVSPYNSDQTPGGGYGRDRNGYGY